MRQERWSNGGRIGWNCVSDQGKRLGKSPGTGEDLMLAERRIVTSSVPQCRKPFVGAKRCCSCGAAGVFEGDGARGWYPIMRGTITEDSQSSNRSNGFVHSLETVFFTYRLQRRCSFNLRNERRTGISPGLSRLSF
jgi:hypothetical protein